MLGNKSGLFNVLAITTKKRLIPILSLLLMIVITLLLFIYRDRVSELNNLGYLGAFLISLVSNATIFLPMPSLLLLFALGAAFNPILVGIFGAAGGALGELSGYIVGYSGRGIARNNQWFIIADKWMKRWGSVTVFLFSLIPVLPIDIAGVCAGVLHFPIWKFLVACFLGKALLYTAISLFGDWGWNLFPFT